MLYQLKFALFVAILAYGIFAITDILFFTPQETYKLLILRLGFGWSVLFSAVFFSKLAVKKKLYDEYVFLTVFLVGVSVIFMILVTDSPAREHYYVGIIFTLIFGYAFVPSRFISISGAGLLLSLGYLLVSIVSSGFSIDVVVVSNLFLFGINIVGMMIIYTLEYNRRVDFFTRMKYANSQTALAELNRELEDRVQERTKQVERSNQDLQNFVYVVSHDLKEPLRQVSSYVSLIERRYKGQLDEKADEFIDFAVDGSNRMTKMIDSLLEFSRLETCGKTMVPVDCNLVMGKTLQILRRLLNESQANVQIDPLPVVLGDDSQLIQLFQNLISNSIKYAGDAPPEIMISAAYDPEMENWEFMVQDKGIGIDQDDLEKIFIIFKRGRNIPDNVPGTGVGLSNCKRIVERHHGQFWVESEIGKGTSFYFTLLDKDNALDPFTDYY